MKRIFLLVVLFLTSLCLGADSFTPTSGYEVRNVRGWEVYIEKAFIAEHADVCDETMRLLEFQLYQIERVVPRGSLLKLKEVAIWIEYDLTDKCACYHPSRGWLVNNKYNPDKEKSVNITNAKHFLQWTIQQPWMVLHEMAHAYHDRVLGWGDPKSEIRALYKKAVESKKYESILHIQGGTQKAYAMNNHKEYFAETAEAYFGTNDMYPFVRVELKKFDPDMYELHKKLWGK